MKWDAIDNLLAAGLRIGLPFLLALLLMAVLYLPTPDFALARLAPAVPLAFVYHRAVYRPQLLPFGLAFALGLAADLWSAGPIGFEAILLYGLGILLVPQERLLRSLDFTMLWALFGVIVFGWLLLQWLVLSLYHWHWLAPWELLFQGLMIGLIYPALARLFDRFDRLVEDVLL